MNILDIAIAKKLAGGGGGSGTDNYNDLSNLPKINDTTLSGNKTSANLGLQSEINSDSKLASDLVDDTNQDNKFVTSSEKSTWNGKQNAIDADHKINADYVDDSTSTNKFVTATDKETWNAKQNAIDSSHKLSSDLVDDTNHTNKFVTSTEKQTWNGKQNAIDSDHKLSSSLVSFTTAEAAALASGIDSTKVGQISTNQTNILYGIDTGNANLLFVPDQTQTSGSLSLTAENGIVRVTGSSTTVTTLILAEHIMLKAGTYYFSGGNGGQSGSNFLRLGKQADDAYIVASYGDAKTQFTLSADTECKLTVYAQASSLNQTYYPMISLFSDSTFRHTLPNYDLTRLEAEDRASLAEEIDAGAKNKFNPANIAELRNLATNGSDYAYVSTTTDTRTQCNFCVFSWNGSTKIDQLTKVDVTANGKIALIFTKTAGYNKISLGHSGQTKDLMIFYNVSDLVNGQTYVLSVNITQFNPSVANFAFSDVMICTKAAFGVSSKFVPYRVPITGVFFANKKYVTSTTETSTGVKFTAPTTAIYKITATATYLGGKPTVLKVTQKHSSSENAYNFLYQEAYTNSTALSVSGMIDLEAGGEFEVFTTYANATNNWINVVVEKIS